MAPRSSISGHQNGRAIHGQGVDEGQLRVGSGLRSANYSAVLRTDTSGLGVLPGTFFAATSGTETFNLQNPVLPVPCTPCFLLLRGQPDTLQISFTVRGLDAQGQPQEEITPTIVPTNTPWVNGVETQQNYVFCSKVFSVITSMSCTYSGGNTSTICVAGYIFPWDRCTGSAHLWNDATGGTYTLTIQEPGGSTQTTGNIAYNAAASAVKSAIEALAQFANRTVDVIGAGTLANPWRIQFNGQAPRDNNDITVDDTNLTGATDGSTLTGIQYHGHDNLGIGIPLDLQAYRPPIGGRSFTDVIGVGLDSLSRTSPQTKGYDVVSISAANPSVVTVSQAMPYEGGLIADTFPVMFTGTGATPDLDGTCHVATATSPTTFTVPVNVTGAGGAAGEAHIIANSQPAQPQLAPADNGPSSTLQRAGYRIGINATDISGWQGSRNKLSLYADSSRTAGAHSITFGTGPREFSTRVDSFSPYVIHMWVNSSVGAGPIDSNVSTYPQG